MCVKMLNTLVASYGKQIGSCIFMSPESRVFPYLGVWLTW